MTTRLPTNLATALQLAAVEFADLDAQMAAIQAPTVATTDQIRQKRAELQARGINLREFCDERGVSYQAARELLIGKAKGRRGKSHAAAVALGLKPDPSTLQLAA